MLWLEKKYNLPKDCDLTQSSLWLDAFEIIGFKSISEYNYALFKISFVWYVEKVIE